MLIGFCRPDSVRYGAKLSTNRRWVTRNPLEVLPVARSVICIAESMSWEDNTWATHGVFTVYPGYASLRARIDVVLSGLLADGYKAVRDRELDYKSIAYACGMGVYGKNTLIVNKEYGTTLRFECCVTDWEPAVWSEKLSYDLCGDCACCRAACPVGSFDGGGFVRSFCNAYYERQGKRCKREGLMCLACQRACPLNEGVVGFASVPVSATYAAIKAKGCFSMDKT